MNTNAFVDRTFNEPLPEHRDLPSENVSESDWDLPIYDWCYYGQNKYGRYAVCQNTGIKRGLTMGEFYGTSPVD